MLFLKIWNLPTGFNLKWLAHFFSLPKFPYQTCVCFQVLWSKGNLDSYRKSKMHEKMFSYSSISLPSLLLKRGLQDRFKLPVSALFFSTKALWGWWRKMGAKKVSFTACHLCKLYLACTSPKVIPTSLKKIDEQNWLQFFCNLNFPPKNHFLNCPSGKLRTEFTSLQ